MTPLLFQLLMESGFEPEAGFLKTRAQGAFRRAGHDHMDAKTATSRTFATEVRKFLRVPYAFAEIVRA